MIRNALFVAALLASSAGLAQVQNSRPMPLPIVDTIPAARDVAYPGTMRLEVDATNWRQAIFDVKQTIPVAQSGPMVLLYPKWLPGNHAPRGPIDKLAGIVFKAGGRTLPWRRDPVDVYAFHIDVPAGAREVVATFQYLSPTRSAEGRIQMTPEMMSLQWEDVSLYPAGYFVRQIPVQATVRYPAGWKAASGLPSTASAQGGAAVYAYQKTDYETLVDSPTIAGKYFRQDVLSDRVRLNTLADDPKYLAATAAQIDAHKRLVTQAVKLFGAQHYDRYEFLLTMSDKLGGIGLEHHRSSENGVEPEYFTDWDKGPGSRNLLPHEFTHSWDGKFRRGADLVTPDYRTPMRNSLLWVYEGQTQFWGYVLQARSGLVSKQDTLDQLAGIAAQLDTRAGTQWRPLVDTTNDPIISARRPKGWVSWQRSEDYYNEGLLIWLEADSIIRKQSNNTKSMDDFARAFFGLTDGDWGVVPYTLQDVATTLNSVVPYDWMNFLTTRSTEVTAGAPLAGFTNNGYRLIYTAEPTKVFADAERESKGISLAYSLGVSLSSTGEITSVAWGSPAFDAGLVAGDSIVAVGDKAYSGDALKAAITAAKGTRVPITVTVKSREEVKPMTFNYHDGLRYPRLEKVGTGENGLDRLLTAR